jgi:transposase
LKRTTLADWMGRVGLALQPLFDALRTQLLASPVLHAD